MNKKNIFKILLFIGLFFTYIGNIFAFDANLQLDKKETDINDYIKLRVEMHSDEGGEIGISDIVGLENFEIIGQAQSQSSSTSVIVVDGKTESKIKTSHNFDITLKAKSKGDFVLGPATLIKGSDKITTNSLKLKVTGDNLFINNNHLNINTRQGGTNLNKTKQNKVNSKEKDIEKYNNIEKKYFYNKNEIILFIIVLFVIGLGFYFLLKKKTKKVDYKESKEEAKKQNIKEEVDFEKKATEIIYPEINDPNFIDKLEKVFRQKLYKKYNIKNIENKTFDEILNETGDKNENIEKIISILNKVKYSNFTLDNNVLFNLLKNI